jgi:hypothetical protein
MTHCAKCGAELIGSRKFCAACGTPVGDPRSPAASTGQAPATAAPYAAMSAPDYASAPVSQVNPFAQTAGPGMKVRASDYGPPLAPTAPGSAPGSVPGEILSTTPGVGGPIPGSQVSPLAISNVASSRDAYKEAVAAALGQAAAPAAPPPPVAKRGSIPGTEIMPSFANPPLAAPSPGSEPSPGAGGTRQERTHVLAAFPGSPSSLPGAPSMPSAPSGQGAHGGQPVNAPAVPGYSQQPPTASTLPSYGQQPPNAPPAPSYAQPPAAPPVIAQPPPAPFIHTPAGAQPPYVPPQPPPPPPYPSQPSQQPPMQGWNAAAPAPYMPPQAPVPYGAAAPYPPAQPPPGYGYGFGYAPGSRVTVTWSNGQRYPGTVQQVSGTQCLVVFPDGQQHWIEMQYVAPG